MEELSAAVETVAASPGAGAPYRRTSLSGMRRVLLPRTRYHLYYTVDETEGVVRVHALWHTARGQGPLL
ncbi:hypothetical protein DB31_7400 [Hyalangium minutum]|uniref:Death on curing protein, Doc toxin n=2 Tax=Hyalangium minutum TaxID=394096 RepID=A0A085WKF0_9BACT|nr:hypothetical protein DB31_7400 [Hyalangium minutum]